MDSSRIERLTDKQRECLRLVYRHMQTKEIARALQLSPDGVTQRLRGAMRTLGVESRREAARILAEAESLGAYPPHVHPSRDIAASLEPATMAPSTGSEWQSGSPGGAIREEQAAFLVAPQGRKPALPLPIGGARPDDLNWLNRLAWIAAIAIGIALAFGGLVGGVDALTRLLRG
ncbi:MAG: helix-turn-helix transcriptional regulator [Sphingomonadaceae bacterium]|nr:helix-turn-helix transcriptional regulator [Sphingomonadaceae bacterium]